MSDERSVLDSASRGYKANLKLEMLFSPGIGARGGHGRHRSASSDVSKLCETATASRCPCRCHRGAYM